MLNIIGDVEHAAVVRDGASSIRYFADGAIVAIGDILSRGRVVAENPKARWLTVIHPSALLGQDVMVKEGTYVGARAIIQRSACIGAHVIIGTGAIVEHDVTVGDFVNIGPGVVIGGGAEVGDGTFLGLGCKVRDHVTIGRGCKVGMGAVVVNDVPDGATVMGVPAR